MLVKFMLYSRAFERLAALLPNKWVPTYVAFSRDALFTGLHTALARVVYINTLLQS